MILTLDVGNTRATWIAHASHAVAWDARPRFCYGDKGRNQPEDADALRAWLATMECNGSILLYSAVAPRRAANMLEIAKQLGAAELIGAGEIKCRIDVANLCREPDRVGKDRLLVASEARHRFGGAAVVVDLGTAITVDAVDETGGFRGGAIAAGPRLLTRALREETEQLPEVQFHAVAAERGRDTQSAIELALFHGTAGMVDRLIEIVAQDLKPRGVLLCGGYAPILAAALKTPHDRERDVVHRALLRLYQNCAAPSVL